MLRWAVESAASENAALSGAGVAVLEELMDSELLQDEDKTLVLAVGGVASSMAYADQDPETYAGAEDIVISDDDDTEVTEDDREA